MRINSINFNNNVVQKQSFGAVKEYAPGTAKEFLGYARKEVFNQLSEIKDVDIWVFGKIKGETKGTKTEMLDVYDIIVKDDTHIIKEFVGTKDKKSAMLEKLDELMLWFKPELNGEAASVVRKTDPIDQERAASIDKTYLNEEAKRSEMAALAHDSVEGQRFIGDFYSDLCKTMLISTNTSWEDKVASINFEA